MTHANHDAFVDREVLRELLERWRSGAVDEREVHETAEEMFETFPDGPPLVPHADPRSIPIEVLSQLEILNVQLITPADIPALMKFLAAEPGQEEVAWQELTNYWKAIDFKRRLMELRDNPNYTKGSLPSD
jgi:hypothetical protein